MPRKPFEQLSARQKTKIYKVCLELFAANGYNHTSVKMITSRLKVADGYLHYYFKGKEDLAMWAIEIALDDWKAHFEKHVGEKNPEDIYSLFKMSVLQMIRFTHDHREAFAAYMRLVNEPNFPLAEFLAERITWIDKRYLDAIEKEIDAGRLRSDLPPTLVAFLIDVLNTRIQEFFYNAALDPIGISQMDDHEINRWLDTLLSVVRNGIRS
ncbi:MAG: TetR/AcrR family transcriptional regulator [Candidatus Lernaella stagnicola]|nr:TetR/AcrR family transcriptional regulator [Candidatus Lernaella stagnicola]